MHTPKSKHQGSSDLQKDILKDRFENVRKISDEYGDYTVSWRSEHKGDEELQANLRIWKLLRELDVMPVFLPHLKREITDLLSKKNRTLSQVSEVLQQDVAKAAKRAITKVVKEGQVEIEVQVPVTVTSCKSCRAAEEKAKEAIRQYEFKQSKSAKAVRRVMDKILSVWRKK